MLETKDGVSRELNGRRYLHAVDSQAHTHDPVLVGTLDTNGVTFDDRAALGSFAGGACAEREGQTGRDDQLAGTSDGIHGLHPQRFRKWEPGCIVPVGTIVRTQSLRIYSHSRQRFPSPYEP